MRKIKIEKRENEKEKKYKSEQGSITLFVLIAMLFFGITLMGIYAASSNKTNLQMSDVSNIEKEYTVTDEDLQNAYVEDAPIMMSISQIYDENKSYEEGYDEDLLHIGDFVNYQLGTWEKSEVIEVEEITNQEFVLEEDVLFSGIEEGQSKNEYKEDAEQLLEVGGWRVFDVNLETEEITLISTGTVEEYNVSNVDSENLAYISEYVLNGNILETEDEFKVDEEYNVRNFSVYENEYAKEAKVLTKTDLEDWYGKFLGTVETNLEEKEIFETIYNEENSDYLNLIDNGEEYLVGIVEENSEVLKLEQENKEVSTVLEDESVGIRILVTLQGEIKIDTEETAKKEVISEDETSVYNVWNIGLEEGEANVNAPKLSEGMIPIKWDGQDWIICTVDDEQWYEYSLENESKWANVMLSDGTYKYGENAVVGTKVEEYELGSMFVWIPRYGYSIANGYNENESGTIEIKFLKDNTNEVRVGETPIWNNESAVGSWNIHPAFTFGDNELRGLWIAKFETSKNTLGQIEVLPNEESLRSVSVSEAFELSVNMNNIENYEYYGIENSDAKIDPHLMKNTEWGAVAYLTYSDYGVKGIEVATNVDVGYITAGSDYINNQNQSTTGNITGIYDLSGGTHEYVAAYVDNLSYNLELNGDKLYSAEAKYKDVYSVEGVENPESNYNNAKKQYGDAIFETSSSYTGNLAWQEGSSNMPSNTTTFFTRGGSATSLTNSGIFAFDNEYSSGTQSQVVGFRITIAN